MVDIAGSNQGVLGYGYDSSTRDRPRSLKTLSVSWGCMDVEGLGSDKEFMLHPGGGRPWDWCESDTRHRPRIQPADVQYLLNRIVETVIRSLGMERRLEVDPATVMLLNRLGIPYRAAETRELVELYNRVATADAVGGLFRSTC
ncbi:MTH938/NDUFAF3 family protein [Glycomyces arizonensis]|uniref:MTH938/NDUFAF3 family protein n=1 Tax=Glycomyces arizonensis TaxID=256035 RepID=UPI001B7FDBC2|nr:MTH938/NDUFAF3 family protein [Glycomyces arizonensis]